MAKLHSCSADMSREYCATIVKIGEVIPIENTDFLATVLVEGRDIVVRRDKVKEGDVMIYVSNESQLNFDFLSKNNEFRDEEYNSNYKDVCEKVGEMLNAGISNEEVESFKAEHCGYFSKTARVRMKKLRGVMSMGYLISPEQMEIFNEKFKGYNWGEYVGEDFDTVDDVLFVKAYVPEVKEGSGKGKGRAEKRIKKFDRMIPGQFAFHYDTDQLQRNMHRFSPETSVSISTKVHGSSIIVGNVKVKSPRWGGLYAKIFNYLPKFLQYTVNEYDTVYSSRKVIKNAEYNPGLNHGFYDVDIWEKYYIILKDIIPHGMTIYGEVAGYVDGRSKGIQELGGVVYDYGCKEGDNIMMPYRIKTVDEEGNVIEYNVQDVYDYTVNNIIPALKELDEKNGTDWASHIMPIDILYNGTMMGLYPHMNPNEHWHENVLECLKNEPRFCMEKNEPLCKNKLPREGIVVRINDDPIPEAYKLKCLKFLGKEAEDMDKGKTNDEEMQERYN